VTWLIDLARVTAWPFGVELFASSKGAVGRHPSAIAVDARRGHVFVANAYDGSVSMVEARSGRVLRTLAGHVLAT
jgi:hypothetical protein